MARTGGGAALDEGHFLHVATLMSQSEAAEADDDADADDGGEARSASSPSIGRIPNSCIPPVHGPLTACSRPASAPRHSPKDEAMQKESASPAPTPIPIPDDFPVIWLDPEDAALTWNQEGTHFPESMPPLEFDFWNCAIHT